jgi:hypothetical protein
MDLMKMLLLFLPLSLVGKPPTAHDHASATQSALIADTQALNS